LNFLSKDDIFNKEINIAQFISYGFFTKDDLEFRFIVIQKYDMNLRASIILKPIKFSEIVLIISQLFNGIKYLHSLGIAHGDICSTNILVNSQLSYACLSNFEMSNRFLIDGVHLIGVKSLKFKHKCLSHIGRDAHYQLRMNSKNIL
jgi:serine/threonine protein kinase